MGLTAHISEDSPQPPWGSYDGAIQNAAVSSTKFVVVSQVVQSLGEYFELGLARRPNGRVSGAVRKEKIVLAFDLQLLKKSIVPASTS